MLKTIQDGATRKRMHTPPKEAGKNAKSCLFSKDNEGLVLSMDDKAYLRPGTDVGVRDTKSGKIYDVSDEDKQRQLPQHYFSTPQVHITPSSLRFMTRH